MRKTVLTVVKKLALVFVCAIVGCSIAASITYFEHGAHTLMPSVIYCDGRRLIISGVNLDRPPSGHFSDYFNLNVWVPDRGLHLQPGERHENPI